MKWRDVLMNPRPAEVAFVFVIFVLSPLYLIFRLHAEPVAPADPARTAAEPRAFRAEGGLPFRVDDIDPNGNLHVKARPAVRVAFSSKRNIFTFFRKTPPPAPPRPRPTPVPTPPPADAGGTGRPAASPTPTPTPPPPPIEGFKYIGLITTTRDKVAVLRKDERLFLGGEDETILVKAKKKPGGEPEKGDKPAEPAAKEEDKEYQLLEIAPDKIVMGYPGLDYRQVIKFEEVKPEPKKEKPSRRRRRR